MARSFARVAVAAAGLALFLGTASIHADSPLDKLMELTFSGPVQIPHATLKAGTYEFRLGESAVNRSIMRVYSPDHSRFFGNFVTAPRTRRELTFEPVVLFKETPAGQPPAVGTLFYPGEYTGWELLYPKDHGKPVVGLFGSSPLTFGAGLNPASTR
jgi:hypothetical protein